MILRIVKLDTGNIISEYIIERLTWFGWIRYRKYFIGIIDDWFWNLNSAESFINDIKKPTKTIIKFYDIN